MAAVWSEETKLGHWLQIEISAVEARVARGQVPEADLQEIRSGAAIDIARWREIEERTRHDVAAFVDMLAEKIGPASRHVHYGMTSSDILDTGLAMQMRDAAALILDGLARLRAVTVALAREHAGTICAGRTHGIHAEPTTFGLKVAGWAFEVQRSLERVAAAKEEVSVGKLSGVVGTYSQLDPAIEEFVCERLGLAPDPSSTQVVARDRHAFFAAALAVAAGTVERIATELRHLARTELGEVEEPFEEGAQKGSSAMPHKKNPWRSERLCGLARIVRAGVVPAVENIALWHERDISHSSVERVLLPDACYALDFMLAEAAEILEGLVVHPDRMRAGLERSFGLLFSQTLLLKLIDAGMTRDDAYRAVQASAMQAWKSQTHLREVLAGNPEITGRLGPSEIESVFDESRYLVHAAQIIKRLDGLEGS